MRASESRSIAVHEAKQAAMEAEAKALLANPRAKPIEAETSTAQPPESGPNPDEIDVIASFPNLARRKANRKPTPEELEEIEELLRPFRRRPPSESMSLEEYRDRHWNHNLIT